MAPTARPTCNLCPNITNERTRLVNFLKFSTILTDSAVEADASWLTPATQMSCVKTLRKRSTSNVGGLNNPGFESGNNSTS